MPFRLIIYFSNGKFLVLTQLDFPQKLGIHPHNCGITPPTEMELHRGLVLCYNPTLLSFRF